MDQIESNSPVIESNSSDSAMECGDPNATSSNNITHIPPHTEPNLSDSEVTIVPNSQGIQEVNAGMEDVIPASMHTATYISERVVWGDLRGNAILANITNAYKEVISWRPNLFLVPSGKVGRDFVDELTRTAEFFQKDSHLEAIALTALITMMPLLLQKPSKKSKAKDHIKYLAERLKKWKSGDLSGLIREGKQIQKNFIKSKNTDHATSQNILKVFSRLMLHGKVSSAVRWLANQKNNVGVHKITEHILEELTNKHPDARDVDPDAILCGPINTPEPVIFEELNGEAIYKAEWSKFRMLEKSTMLKVL